MFEKVNPSHPDKVADRIAGAMVDQAYKLCTNPKIAVEVLLGHKHAFVIAETSEKLSEHVPGIVQRISGITDTKYIEVPQDFHLAKNQSENIRCGDNGIFKGLSRNHEQFILTKIAGVLYKDHPFDGKYIINLNRKSNIKPQACDSLTICQSFVKEPSVVVKLIRDFCPSLSSTPILVNPLGPWTGGSDVDCGATNRKLGSDMGDAVTGGGLHGKDLSKADVSVNIMCHLLALQSGAETKAMCSIGDERVLFYVKGKPVYYQYSEVVDKAKKYINSIGGFEKFAEWGLIRP